MSEEDDEISASLPEAAPTAPQRKPATRPHTAGAWTRTTQFLRDVRAEMRRVSWPTANEVRNTTIITLIAVIFFALYLFGVDRVWAFLIEHLRGLLGG